MQQDIQRYADAIYSPLHNPAMSIPVDPDPGAAATASRGTAAPASAHPPSLRLPLPLPLQLPLVQIGPPSPCTPPVSPLPAAANAATASASAGKLKLRNTKQLSLFVPSAAAALSADPPSPTLGQYRDITETRSLPPTPRLALHPVNGPNQIITDGNGNGSITMGSDADLLDPEARNRLTAALNGSMTMKRRTSLPRLNLAATRSLTLPSSTWSNAGEVPPTPSVGTAAPHLPMPLTVENLVARNREAGAPALEDSSEAQEEFPYQYGPKEILPGLYLGSEQNAKDPAILRKHGITTVLCVAKEVQCPWLTEVSCPDIPEAEEEMEEEQMDEAALVPPHAAATLAMGNRLRVTASDVSTPHLSPDSRSRSSSRPLLIRSSASTPNLQLRFREAVASTSDLSSADSHSRDPSLACSNSTVARSAALHSGYLHREFPSNRLSGRPAIRYTKLPWGHDEDDIATHFATYSICELIDQAREEGGSCLVHCQLGVSRSATLMIGYCMRQAGLGTEEALTGVKTMHESYTYVRARSRWVAPNIGLLVSIRIRAQFANFADTALRLEGAARAIRASPCFAARQSTPPIHQFRLLR